MAADAVDPTPPRSLALGLRLVLIGVWLAAVDGTADTVISLRLLTHTFDGSKFGELWGLTGVRVVVYIAAILGTLALRRRTLRGRDGARVGLVALLCLFAVGGVANLVTAWVQLLGAAMGGDYAAPLEPWVNYLSLASMAADVVLVVLAVTAAVLLLAGRRWTAPPPLG